MNQTECAGCDKKSSFKHQGTYSKTGSPLFVCNLCDVGLYTKWPPAWLSRKRQRVTKPSPPATVVEEEEEDEDTTDTISQLQETVQTLQKTINQMASLIASLTPLQSQVARLEKRITQLESSNHEMPHITTKDQDQEPESSPRMSPDIPSSPQVKPLYSQVTKRHKLPAKKQRRETVIRAFQLPAETKNENYEIIYIPIKYRMPHAIIRSKLRRLNIEAHRVLDIHFPFKYIAGLLVHAEYARKLEQTLAENGIEEVNYGPHDPDFLNDPKFNDLPKEQQISMAKDIQEQRLIRAVSLVKPHVAMSLARGLYAQGWISEEGFQQILAQRRSSKANKTVQGSVSPNIMDDVSIE
ncbi:hypothetical protein BC943DRAFT_282560 [Umbelopsis sp. AD052]|nr:hypothetical protein BC943DRAFT_282560 [Umbelopsis sp. AD052]